MNKQTQPQFSSLILTYNEEVNLSACLKSLELLNSEVIIVDSGSTDKTLEIAECYGAKIYFHKFETSSKQVNWALDNIPMQGDWIIRLDADERLTQELVGELVDLFSRHAWGDCTGFYMKRRYYFMGRWIRYGGIYPTWLLRLWRNGKARSEDNPATDHMILEGKAGWLKYDIVDWNQKDLTYWTDKHNRRSKRRVYELLSIQDGSINYRANISASIFGSQPARKRWMKYRIYARLPAFFRCLAYFLYRYILRGGFFDGKAGLVFHFLHGFWYQFLIDAKLLEMKQHRQRAFVSPVPK